MDLPCGSPEAIHALASKRLRQSGLTQDCICRVPAWDADGHRETPFRDRAIPDFVAALALPDEGATCRPQQLAQRLVELRRHSIHAAAGSASRSAVICRKREAGSMSG